jgi:hypothetical protein
MSDWLSYIGIFAICIVGGFLIGSTFNLHLDHHQLKVIGKGGILLVIGGCGLYYWWVNR